LIINVVAWFKHKNNNKCVAGAVYFSVIIPARNEELHIEACIDSVLAQHYDKRRFEIIIINDHSVDATELLIQQKIAAATEAGFQIRYINLLPDKNGKKAALTAGIELASGEWIATTDADSVVSLEWLQTLATYTDKYAMLAGPVRIITQKRHWLSQFQALEVAALTWLAAANIFRKQPMLCNGANLCYRKSIFEQVGGFQGIDRVASGDDELLMHKIQRAGYQIGFVDRPQATVDTKACMNFTELWRQRVRWVSKRSAYNYPAMQRAQMAAWFSALIFWVGLIGWLFNWADVYFFMLVTIPKMLLEFLILYQGTQLLKQQQLLYRFIIDFPIYTLFVVVIGIRGLLPIKYYRWKGRKVK
jgi:cellulose synthase/poly-beta-1,6-N-acetylglucosamine synthase-like glycosyltransferase